ncbi:MAG: MerR family transcriptional regulator [Chitinophagales bacterium]|nr:MerR family transcriptional regulator [Chitinophagales bacterium]
MQKSLTQITFDFSSPEGEVTPPKPVEEILLEKRPLVAPKPPSAEKVFEEPVEEKEEEAVSIETLPARKSTRGRRSLKEISQMADLVNVPPDEILFQKQYYSIGEVAVWFQVNQSLLRYWESEFTLLKPRKNRKGDRFFRPEDVKNLQLIYDLLRRRKFTIEGAKDFLKNNKKAEQKFEMIRSLEGIRGFLLELKANL